MLKQWIMTLVIGAIVTFSTAGTVEAQSRRRSDSNSRLSREVLEAFSPSIQKVKASTVRLMNQTGLQFGYGIAIDETHLVTKASLLGKRRRIACRTADGRRQIAEVVAKSEDHDIALLEVEIPLTPIRWINIKTKVGQWLASVGTDELPETIGVVSTPRLKVPWLWTGGRGGFLGVGGKDLTPEESEQFGISGGMKITSVVKGSSAARIGLEVNDIILSIDGTSISSFGELAEKIGGRPMGEVLLLDVLRGDIRKEYKVTLGKRPKPSGGRGAARRAHRNGLRGPVSKRRAGFPDVILHDSWLSPHAVGGPVVDIEGNFIGMNIARAGRVSTYAIPADVLQEVVEELKEKAHKLTRRRSGRKF